MGPANALIARVLGSGMSSNVLKRSGAFQVDGMPGAPRSANLRNGEVALSSDSTVLAIGEAAKAGTEAASELSPVGPGGATPKLVGAVDPMAAVVSVAVTASTFVVGSVAVAASMAAVVSVAVAASTLAVDSVAVAVSMAAVDSMAVSASTLAVGSVAVAVSMAAVDSTAVAVSTFVLDSVAVALVSDVPEVAVSAATSAGLVRLMGVPSVSAGWMSRVGAGETASGA